LNHRASERYEQNGFAGEAIEHALRAEDFERAAFLVEAHFDAMYQRGAHIKMRRWLAALPVELVFSKPHLCILYAWNLFSSGQMDAAEQSLQAVERALESGTECASTSSPMEQDQLRGTDSLKLQGQAAAIRAFLATYRGDVPGTIQYARQALDVLPKQEFTWRSAAAIALGDAYELRGEMAAAHQVRLDALVTSTAAGDVYLFTIANLKAAVTLKMQGQLQRVREICQQQMQLAQENGISQTVVAGWLLAICGEALAELNDLDKANHQAIKGVELTERGRDVAMRGWSNLRLLRVLFSSGDMAGAEAVVQKMEHTARDFHVPPWITNQMAAWQARIWLAQDKRDAASRWARERGLNADGDLTILHEMEHIALARILIAEGRLDETHRLLQRLLESAETGGRTTSWSDWVGEMTISVESVGDGPPVTTLTGVVADQAALQSLLRRLYSVGLPLISVNCVACDSED